MEGGKTTGLLELKTRALKLIRGVGTGCNSSHLETYLACSDEDFVTVVNELHQAGMITKIRTANSDFYYPVQLINVLCDVVDLKGAVRLTEGHTYAIKESNSRSIWVMCDLGFKYRLVKGSKKYENAF